MTAFQQLIAFAVLKALGGDIAVYALDIIAGHPLGIEVVEVEEFDGVVILDLFRDVTADKDRGDHGDTGGDQGDLAEGAALWRYACFLHGEGTDPITVGFFRHFYGDSIQKTVKLLRLTIIQ